VNTATEPLRGWYRPDLVPTAPCPLCRWPIRAGGSAAAHGGDVVHAECYLILIRADEDLLAYLKQHAGAAFCTTCLVAATGVTFDQVLLAQGWLSARAGARLEMSTCSACARERMTLAYVGKDAVSTPH
jgi:hypothetical protein